jgi:2-methylcitrate synthase/citrate synthase II
MSTASGPPPIYSPGLEGVIAGETAISTIEEGLCYRGYPVGELVEHCTFEEVAFLLLYSELPKRTELVEFRKRVAANRHLPQPLRTLLHTLPNATSGMDSLRSSISVLAHFDSDVNDNSRAANIRKAERLLGQIPSAIADQYHFSQGAMGVAPRPDLSHGANFLYMIRGAEPSAEETKAFDVSLILYAEHEFNASTFTTRVVASTESDLHSSIVAGVGALKGALHGGANERIMELLHDAGGPGTAEAWVMDALAKKRRIMGFGHRIYKAGDVRAGILKPIARELADAAGFGKYEETAEIVEGIMAREKKLYPNLDWPAGRLYNALGLKNSLYTPIFVMSRVAGWSAHVIEQHEHNRLIRPRSRYTGPGKRTVPTADRW